MSKDYALWHPVKSRLNDIESKAFFQEREIWWCSLGANVGYEQDGHGELFTRPVVILTKFNLDSYLIVPLTARPKTGRYYFPIGTVEGKEATAVLSQIRYLDQKRLQVKIATIDRERFKALRVAVGRACFPILK